MRQITHTNNTTSLRASWYLPIDGTEKENKHDAIKAIVMYQDVCFNTKKGIQLSIKRVTIEKNNGYNMESNMLGNGGRVMLCELSRKNAKAYNDAVAYFDAIAKTTLETIANSNPDAGCYALDDVYREVMRPLVNVLNK